MSVKLTDEQISFLKLIDRSPTVEGWSKVSSMLTPIVKDMNIPELMDIEDRDGVTFIRLTKSGEAIVKWI